MEKHNTHLETGIEPLQEATISMIISVITNLRDVPEELLPDLKSFLLRWGSGRSYKDPPPPHIEIRPYGISELAAMDGMPSRGTIYKILKDLGLQDEQTRSANGNLAPEVVERIINYRKAPAPSRNPRGRSSKSNPKTKHLS